MIKNGYNLLPSVDINDEMSELLLEFIDKYDRWPEIYLSLGVYIQHMAKKPGNKHWIQNQYIDKFKESMSSFPNIINSHLKQGAILPINIRTVAMARIFALNKSTEIKIKPISFGDMNLALLLITALDDSYNISSEIDYKTAMLADNTMYASSKFVDSHVARANEFTNILFYNGYKDYSFMSYYLTILLKSLTENDRYIGENVEFFSIFQIKNVSDVDLQNYRENLFVRKNNRVYFPMSSLSIMLFEENLKHQIILNEKKLNKNPNDFISKIWTRSKESMMVNKILKTEKVEGEIWLSENSLKKNCTIFGDEIKYEWTGKKSIFTPDLVLIKNNDMYCFDIKIIYPDDKFLKFEKSYWCKIREHCKSIRKLMQLIKERNINYEKYYYIISNDLCKIGVLLKDIIIRDIKKMFYEEYKREINKNIFLFFKTNWSLEFWLGSNRSLDVLFEKHNDYASLIASDNLLTKEMLNYFKDKPEMKKLNKNK